MNVPKTADDLKNEIYLCSDKFDDTGDLRIRQLIKILPNVSDHIIIEGIFKIFETDNRSDKLYQDQELAGRILNIIKPKSNEEPIVLLKRILTNWNESIEQLPLWFKENFGFDIIMTALYDLDLSEISDFEKNKIRTMKWWLEIK